MSAMTRTLLGGLVASALAVAATGASASTTLTYQGAAYPSYQSGYIQYNDGAGGYPDSTKNVYVGGFNMLNTSTNKSLIAWCVDIFDTVHNATYTDGNPASINNISKLQQLVSQSYSKVNNAETSAAFQLAVWEIVNETAGSSSFSLGTGQFTAYGGNLSNAVALANDWLKLDKAVTGDYNLAYYFYGNMPNGVTQNLISMSPVPLPAAGWLMLSALGMGGWLTRRRANRAALATA